MSRDRRLLSVLLAYHLAAVTFAALPAPRELNPVDNVRHPDGSGPAVWLTPAFDRLALWMSEVQPALFRASEPIRLLTQPYIDAGLRQKWNMFSNPGTDDQYLRVDFVLSSAATPGLSGGAPLVYREIVFPADDESRPRWVHQFRDKVIFNAIENYFIRLREEKSEEESQTAPVRDLEPVIRHFTNLFLGLHPEHAARLLRTELWLGAAPIPTPGAELDVATLDARLASLDRYRGAVAPLTTTAARPLGSLARDVDIEWTLVDIEEAAP